MACDASLHTVAMTSLAGFRRISMSLLCDELLHGKKRVSQDCAHAWTLFPGPFPGWVDYWRCGGGQSCCRFTTRTRGCYERKMLMMQDTLLQFNVAQVHSFFGDPSTIENKAFKALLWIHFNLLAFRKCQRISAVFSGPWHGATWATWLQAAPVRCTLKTGL